MKKYARRKRHDPTLSENKICRIASHVYKEYIGVSGVNTGYSNGYCRRLAPDKEME